MKSRSVVFFESTATECLEKKYSYTAKFDAIINKLKIGDRVKNKQVAIKMHVGEGENFSTVHPYLIGRLIREIKKHEGKPYIIDVPEQIEKAHLRGYTENVLGCKLIPVAGFRDNYFIEKEVNYKGLKMLRMGGNVKDADILINVSHVKSHNSTGFGAAIKNLAVGCYTQKTRNQMHRTMQYDSYWDPAKCKDPEKLQKVCPYGAIQWKKNRLKVEFDSCNQCMRCIQVDNDKCLQINRRNFGSFFEICAIAANLVLSEIGKENCYHINVALDMTERCDCWGFTTGNILPDLGFLGSRDILGIDKATLDLTADKSLIVENVAKTSEIVDNPNLHPFAKLNGPYKDPYLQIYYGEKYRLGNLEYILKKVISPIKIEKRIRSIFPEAIPIYQKVSKLGS